MSPTRLAIVALLVGACTSDPKPGTTTPTTPTPTEPTTPTGDTSPPLATTETDCDDGIDNDGNGFIDCIDLACRGTPECVENTDAACSDEVDNDGDGRVDCADTSCAGHPEVTVCPSEKKCGDDLDDDGDGRIDCADLDCWAIEPGCAEDTVDECTDTADNDLDGFTDCDDFDCYWDSATQSQCAGQREATPEECSDGVTTTRAASRTAMTSSADDPRCRARPARATR